MQTLKKYLSLFAVMLKIGLFAFGGGYAVIALIEGELVEKKKWLGKEEFCTSFTGCAKFLLCYVYRSG